MSASMLVTVEKWRRLTGRLAEMEAEVGRTRAELNESRAEIESYLRTHPGRVLLSASNGEGSPVAIYLDRHGYLTSQECVWSHDALAMPSKPESDREMMREIVAGFTLDGHGDSVPARQSSIS